MVKCRRFSRMVFTPQFRGVPVRKRPKAIRGMDTETFKGRCFLLTASTGEYVETKTIKECLEFLSLHRFRSTLNFFWNLQFDVQAVLSYLNRAQLESLYFLGKLDVEDWTVRYIPRKLFSVRKKSHSVTYFDLYQFFFCSLDKASQKYLGQKKIDLDVTKFKDKSFIDANMPLILEYCLKDSFLVQKLGEYFQNLCQKANVDFNRPISPANVSERYFKQNANIPRLYEPKAQRYAMQTYYGGRFEVMRRGYIPKCYCYDINSAYPAVMADLMDLEAGKWVLAYEDDPTYEYGFCRAWVTLNKDYINPVPFDNRQVLIFPKMKRTRRFITLDEIRFIRKYNLGTVKVIDGYFWTPEDVIHPFENLKDLYRFRRRLKDEENDLEYIYKVIMNSIYGKMIQLTPILYRVHEKHPKRIDLDIVMGPNAGSYVKYWKTGQLFNPAYGSLITTRVRLQCHEAMLKAGEDAVAVFTDGLFTKRKHLPSSSQLGQWKLEGVGELLILGSGIYTFDMQHKRKTAYRGFSADTSYNFFEILAENPRETSILFEKERVVQLGEYLAHKNLWTPGMLNTFVKRIRKLNLNFDTKRKWVRDFKNSRDALENEITSFPLQV